MAPSRRTSGRTSRKAPQAKSNGRRDQRSGSGRVASRNASSRRDSSESDRYSPRNGRSGRVASKDNRLYIFGGVAAAALLLILVIAAASGSKSRPKPKQRKPNVSAVASSSPVDWYMYGIRDGREWAIRARARHQQFTADTVNEIAERMPSNYANKGIDAAGEQRFIQGFKAGVYEQ